VDFDRRTGLSTRLRRGALAFDGWLNDALYKAGRRISDIYTSFSIKTDRLSVSGGKRVMAEFASEGLNIGTGGALLMLALAIPAFNETRDDWLKTQELAVTFLDRYGEEIGKRGIRHNDAFSLDQLPDHLIKAVLATEDRRFYEHFGIDTIGTVRALAVNTRASGVVQGGSTITQQLAKNLFLTNERSLERKIKEAFLAIWLEARLTKADILKLYLDRAYMGGGTFGVAAASEYYFGKSARDITLAEAAMLAGLFKAPTKFAPHANLPAARGRANDVLSNMVEAGFLTEGQIQTARRNPATPIERRRDATPDYFLDWAFDDVKRMSDQKKLGTDRVLTVKTPLDLGIQRRADASIEAVLRQHGSSYNAQQSAAVIMDPDGAVRAMVGGRDYGLSQFNRATGALRQPGSSFKPFVYAAAMSAGLYRPDTIVTDSPVCIGNWCPNNYGRSYAGAMPLTVALAKSINTVPVRMSIALGKAESPNHDARAAQIGRAKIIDTSRRMGLTTPLADTVSLPIGAAEVTVIDMAAGYAVFANGGKRAKPYAAVEIYNSQGDIIWRQSRDAGQAEQVLATQVVSDMNIMLGTVPESGTGRRAAIDGIKSAGKTGTTNGYKDAWYVGYTGNLVGAVWFGNDDSTSTNNMTGGSLPAMAWHEIMSFAHQSIDLKPIPGIPVSTPVANATPGPAPRPSLVDISQQTTSAATLSRRSYEVLTGIDQMMRKAREVQTLKPSGTRASVHDLGQSGSQNRTMLP
jgi:penicillin-binding protein 1A